MYLVELRPGKEELYRSSDELALAIRNGDVDARSRIYHRATAKWISITLHPQYKAIITAPKEDPAARPVRKGWTFLGGINPPAEPVLEPRPTTNPLLQQLRGPLALSISGLLLLLGIQLAFSGPRPPWANQTRTLAKVAPKEVRRLASTSQPKLREGMVSLAGVTTVWPSELPAVDTTPRPAAAVRRYLLPRAPRFRTNSLRAVLEAGNSKKVDTTSIDAFLGRYQAAHDSARSRLEGGIRVARLSRLFAAARLNPNGGVTDTRMSLAGVANFIRIFRQEQAAIESAYQDSVTLLAKEYRWKPKEVRRWYSRAAPSEEPTLQVLSGSLLAGIDSVLGVLAAQAGAYKIRGTAIAFEDPTAAQTYGALRRRIKEQIDSAISAGAATSSGPTGLLLQAIGTTTLPRET
jgi:hypothetical protein